jgi:hypothetical protein
MQNKQTNKQTDKQTNSYEAARKNNISQCKHHKVEITKAETYVNCR